MHSNHESHQNFPHKNAASSHSVVHHRSRLNSAEAPNLPTIYLRTLLRARWLVLALALGAGLLGFLATLPQAPVYRARTSLDIQALNENFMNLRAVDPTDRLSNNSADTFLQTEIKLIESASVLNRAVAVMKKANANRPPGGTDSPARGYTSFPLSNPNRIERDVLIDQVAKSIKVKPLGMTRLVEISCESTDRQMAADFCNTLASEFVAHDLEVRWESAQRTSEWLGRQLEEVRGKLRVSEQQLQAFAQSNSLLFNEAKESVEQDRLRLLQAQLAQAEVERGSREAQYRVGTSVTPDSLPAVLDDEPSRQYQMKLAELQREYAELSTSFTPTSAKVEKVAAQIAALEASIKQARENLIGRLRNEYTVAAEREKKVKNSYSAQQKTVSAQVTKTAQLNMLQRDAESGRQLYAALLQRVKEAGFASALKSSPIRVVDTAALPTVPVSPRRLATSLVGLLGGSFLGIALAFYRERTDRHFRKPGDAAKYFSMREFGVIPSAREETTSDQRLTGFRAFLNPIQNALIPSGVLKRAGQPALETISWYRKRSLMAESYRAAMSSLVFSRAAIERSILISSPTLGEGKTTLVSNLGISIAESGRRVVLVDADLRVSRLHNVFDTGNNCGLRNVLLGEIDPETCPVGMLAQPTMVPNLFVLPSGTGAGDPVRLLHSKALELLIRRLEKEFDVVLIDSPPLLHLADARPIAQLTGGTVLVLRAGVATRESAAAAFDLLEGDETPILGIIFNDFDPGREGLRNYYDDYYRYRHHGARVEREQQAQA